LTGRRVGPLQSKIMLMYHRTAGRTTGIHYASRRLFFAAQALYNYVKIHTNYTHRLGNGQQQTVKQNTNSCIKANYE